MNAEFLVVGSGPSGVIAAEALVNSGKSVLLLDGGSRGPVGGATDATKAFVELRRTDTEQQRYLLGEQFESVALETVTTGAQLTPARRFITKHVDTFLPLRSETFQALESLAAGGLGSGWGLGSCVFSVDELKAARLPVSEMHKAYKIVAERIGICASDDDARPYTWAHIDNVQPPPPLDPAAAQIYKRYIGMRERMHRRGMRMGRPALALLTGEHDGRPGSTLREMEFYEDDGSAWRPWLVLDQLVAKRNFTYRGGFVVLRFAESSDHVEVTALDIATAKLHNFRCRTLVLAASALGTARIVLRSVNPRQRVPVLCNPYSYIPMLVPQQLGKAKPSRGISLSQLAFFDDESAESMPDIGMAFVYSYRSLMLFRLLREAPINVRDARLLLQYLMPALLVVGIHHPESASSEKYAMMEADATSPTRDRLFVSYSLTTEETMRVRRRNRKYAAAFRALGAWPIKTIEMPAGASIHYAGTLPFGNGEPLTLSRDGRLAGSRRVFVADGSGFTYLPAKGLTLSLMANAYRTAQGLCRISTQ